MSEDTQAPFRREWYRVAITSDRSIKGLFWPLRPAVDPNAAPAPKVAPEIVPALPALPREPPGSAVAISILNISAGGIAGTYPIEIDHATPESGELIGLVLERGSKRLMLRAEVRHTQPSPGGGSFKFGARFLLDPDSAPDRRMLHAIQALIAELEREQLQRRSKYGPKEEDEEKA